MIIIPLAIFIAVISLAPDNMDTEQWKMVRNKGGVQTFLRWTTNDSGASIRERKGEMQVSCSMQEAVHLVSDAESTTKWMASISEYYNLARINQNEWYTYTLFSIPWPFTKRDLVSFNKLVSDPKHGTITIVITCKDKYVPMKPGIERLTDYKAIWVINQIGEKNIKISFSAISSAPLAFPRYIQDPIIERMFHNNLIRLREMLTGS